MARDHFCYDQEEEDYIDMDPNSAAYARCSPTEFEFQMSSKSPGADHGSASPADEIFYEGKLLPLHLPPRLQMVETLLRKPGGGHAASGAATADSTPFASCNISPATSCYVSGELSPEDYFSFFEEEEGGPKEPVGPRAKRSWARKLKQSPLGLKLRASKAYIQSLFARPPAPRAKDCSMGGGHPKKDQRKKSAASAEAGECGHRRSFSGTVKRGSPNKCSSSSASSCSSSSSSSFSSLKRSSSVSSDKECSIQGAIAHCKKSQQAQAQAQAFGRKSVSDVGFYFKSECEEKRAAV